MKLGSFGTEEYYAKAWRLRGWNVVPDEIIHFIL
jgi:hypothetical protein